MRITIEGITADRFQQLKTGINEMTDVELMEHAEEALVAFESFGAAIVGAWKLGSRQIKDTSEEWGQLYRLAWVFCKSTQLYRIRKSPCRSAEYGSLTKQFADCVRELIQRGVELSATLPKRQSKFVIEVAGRAEQRSDGTTRILTQGRAVDSVIKRLYPIASSPSGKRASKPR